MGRCVPLLGAGRVQQHGAKPPLPDKCKLSHAHLCVCVCVCTCVAQMEEHNDTRMRMNADMADSSNLVKQLLIKAEDVRILGDMKNMRRAYKKLFDLNK